MLEYFVQLLVHTMGICKGGVNIVRITTLMPEHII